jgi:hypothetical protein
LLDAFVATGDTEKLFTYLISQSNLPSPRANLELAWAFGDALKVSAQCPGMWTLCEQMVAVSIEQAPVNSPEEFVPCCGAIGVGALGATLPAYFDAAVLTLRRLARDRRWRMREGVCFGLQRLLAERPQDTLRSLEQWSTYGDPLELRAVVAAVADPPLLKDPAMAAPALELHRKVMQHVQQMPERKSTAFKTLRQALGYSLSVVVQAVPETGFEYLAQLVVSPDKDVQWIARQNLQKARLAKQFSAQVRAILDTGGA